MFQEINLEVYHASKCVHAEKQHLSVPAGQKSCR